MFTFSRLLDFFRINPVFASSDSPESTESTNVNIPKDNKEKGKKDPQKERSRRRERSREGQCGGRHGRSNSPRSKSPGARNASSSRDSGKPRDTKDAGDSAAAPAAAAMPCHPAVPAAAAASSNNTAAGDQDSPVCLPCYPVKKMKGRRDSMCGKGVGDRGTTGAGVTGSRADGDSDEDSSLPPGAAHPGLLRHIHNAARYTLPQCFEGACMSVKQSTNSHWVLGHSMSFSSVTPGGYKLLLSYIEKNKPTALPYFVMETSPGGQVSCEFRVAPTHSSRAAFVSQIADAEFKTFESIIDLYFSRATASMIAVNREFIALHYLHGISKRVSVGAEVVTRGQFSEVSAGSGALRWASDDVAISGTLGNRGLDVCYARAVQPHLTVAAMIEVGFSVPRAVGTLAYEWRADRWVFRGSLDSAGLVGATLHHKIGGPNSRLACAVSALLNHPNDKFKLGFGVTAAIM